MCMQVKKQQLELDMEQQTGSKLEKEYIKAVYCHRVCLTYVEYIMQNAGLNEAQAGIKISGRNINSLGYADNITLMAENEEEVTPLDERGEWKTGLKLNIKKTKIMACGLITSNRWQIAGETMETVTDLIFLGFKITADGDNSHEIKRCLLLWRKAMTNLDSVLKSRDIILSTKVCLVKAMIFPVVM